MRHIVFFFLVLFVWTLGAALAAEPTKGTAIAKPEAFKTLLGPDCSHCIVEGQRRKAELRTDDRVLCWRQVFQDGYTNDGAIPLRFFLNTYRVLYDGWGMFVYDPDAGFVRGFSPAGGPYHFHGWRNGVMVIQGKDGTLYSGLTGIAFEGPKKGTQLQSLVTLVSDWGFWHERYPQALAYTMYDKYRPVELPTVVNEDSRKSRGPADPRLPADAMVLGVWDGKHARAYPLEALKRVGVLYDASEGEARVVFWYGPTQTAAAYRPAVFRSGQAGGYVGEGIFTVDPKGGAAPFVDRRTGGHWDITGRGMGGGPMLAWMDSVQVKWFAWAAEYPQTSIYGKSLAEKDSPKTSYKSLTDKNSDIAGPFGNLDVASRHFGILKAADPQRQRVTLLIDGETQTQEWPVRAGAELWYAGWWGRLDQFTLGDRVWVWFETDGAKKRVAVSLLADELSEQDLYAPVQVKAVNDAGREGITLTVETVRGGKPVVQAVKLAKAEVYRGDVKVPPDRLKPGETVHVQTTGEDARLILDTSAFEKRRSAQKIALRKRWTDDGLPGTLIFLHPERRQVELMLDHEAIHWGRSLDVGDKVTLEAANSIPVVVRQIRPWRERTQVLLEADRWEPSILTVGQRVPLRLAAPPAAVDDDVPPTGLGKSRSKPQRVERLMASVYCTCGMHDGCAGHFFTLAACNSSPGHPCALAKRTREETAERIDKGDTDQQIFADLLKERGPKLLRPHMSP